jgi:hypothetical protein
VAQNKVATVAADSGAVPIVRKAQRRSLAPTGIAHATHRIAASTGWAHPSSAKALSLLQQLAEAAWRESTDAVRQGGRPGCTPQQSGEPARERIRTLMPRRTPVMSASFCLK